MRNFSNLKLVLLAVSLCLGVIPRARGEISVDGTLSFDNITIDPVSGTIDILTLQGSAFAQAGPNSQYNFGSPASASDVPVTGALAQGNGTSSILPLQGSSSASGFVPGNTAGYDTSAGRGSIGGTFEITGVSGPVTVTFSADITSTLDLSSDLYGEYGQGEDIFTLSINGNTMLFNDNLLTIGPDQTLSDDYSTTLTDTVTLMPNTDYSLWIEADSEADVINSSIAVPEPSESALAACLLLSIGIVAFVRRRGMKALKTRLPLFVMALALPLFALPARAMYIGSDAPDVCPKCGFPPTRQQLGGSGTSITEGNMQVNYPVVKVGSGFGPTLPFALTYNSYNANGSKAQLSIGAGFGWSYTYNTLLFQQRGQMFQLGDDGRVTQFYQNYSVPGTYTSDTGYFETMMMQPDGSFIVTNKYQSWWHFGLVTNTSFLVAGPVYRLLQTGDRDGNVTTMTYNQGGFLTTAEDTYGRTLQFTYNSSNELASVTDPLGRVTTFQYDAQDRELTQITDPLGHITTYSYNAEYQMTEKTDPDGRTYFYMYRDLRPFASADSDGDPWFSMSNPDNWAVNETNLAYTLRREYDPGTTAYTDGRGNTWSYSYDTNGYVTQMTDPNGSITTYTYDSNTHMLSSLTDANGHVTHYQYDSDGNRTNMTDALGYVTTYTYEPIFNQITSMTDPQGRTTTYQYDTRGDRIQQVDPLGETNSWTYDAHGNVLTYTDKRGNTTIYTYDSYGNPLSVTDPMDNVTHYAYDSIGNMISTTDPRGNTTTYQYDALDRLIGMTNALGGVTTYTYDADGRELSMTDPNTNTTSYVYDLRGRLIQTTDALNGVTRYSYDANDNHLAVTNQLDHVTTYSYDALNRMVEATDAVGGVTRYTYDAVGNQLTSTDPNTNTTYNAYDALNRVVETTNALGGVTAYDYSMPGGSPCCGPTPGTSLITRMQDPDGNITYYHYDELNRQVQVVHKNSDTNDVINPGDAVTMTAYDPDNNVVAVTDPNGNTTTYFYDADDRQVSMIDPVGDTTLSSYDADGNVVTVTEPNLNLVTNSYDALNRVITRYDQVGLVTSNTYDAVGNILSSADGLGNTTIYVYDGLNRRVESIDPLNRTTTTVYDADGNVTQTTDRNNRITTYMYDGLDRRVSVTDALGATTSTGYDQDNNIISATDGNGHVTSFTYDALNRTITETYPDAAPNTRTNVYDAVGNLIERLDQNGQVTTYTYNDLYFLTNRAYLPSGSDDSFLYDAGGRTLTADRNGWVDTFAYDGANRLTNTMQDGRVLTYTYDVPDRVQTNTQPSGRVLVYTYDARDRMATLQDQTVNPPIVNYVYDAADRVVTRTYRNGTTSGYSYNPNNWITSITHSNSTSLISGLNYAYDNEGNELYEQSLDNPSGSRTFIYDGLNRLTNYDVGVLSGSVIPSPAISKMWNLDAVGNWNVVTSNGVPQVRSHSASDELLTVNGSNYLYDANGNLLQDNSYQYVYDEENRVTQARRRSDSAIVGQYYYDALGRRVMAVTSPGIVVQTNLYFYDHQSIIEEQNPAGSTTATYTYGNYVDDVLTMNRGGQTYYYHANALWTPYALSDSSGNVAERYAYDAYGYVTVLGPAYGPIPLNPWGTPHSAVGNAFLFTGRELDEETGLYFYRTRFMDSDEGRFIVRDLAGVWSDPGNWGNGYAYVGDRPIDRTDPYGTTLWVDEKWDKNESKKACEAARAAEARGETVRFKVFVGTIHDDIKDGMISEAETAGSKGYVVYNYYQHPTEHKVDVPKGVNWNTKAKETCGIKGKSCVEEVVVSGHNRDPLWNVANDLKNTTLCDSCHIWLTGCWTATAGGNAQQLANDTKCTVHGSLVSLGSGVWAKDETTQRNWTWEGVFSWYRNEDVWREFTPGQAANQPAAPCPKCGK